MSIIFKGNRVNGKQHDQSSSGSGVQFYIAKGFFDTIPRALDGPNLFWCRSDWLKQYHFKTPQTLSNVEKIVKVFNQRRKTDGLIVDTQQWIRKNSQIV